MIKILTVCEKILTGEMNLRNVEVGKILTKKGYQIGRILVDNYNDEIVEEFIKNNYKDNDYCIIFTEDKNIDSLINKNIKYLDKNYKIIDEQAVLFEKELAKLLILPIGYANSFLVK